MKKVLVILMTVFLLTGCAASTLSMRNADGSTMDMRNYVVTESYSTDGKLTARTFVPAENILKGSLDKILDVVKSILELTGLGDANK